MCDDGYRLRVVSIPGIQALYATHSRREERSVKRAKTAEMASEASATPLPTLANATRDGLVLSATRWERSATHSHRYTEEEPAPLMRTVATSDLTNAIHSTLVENAREASVSASTVTHVHTVPHLGIQNQLRRETSSATTEPPRSLSRSPLSFPSWFSLLTTCELVCLRSSKPLMEGSYHWNRHIMPFPISVNC